jgi:hypothetical protein
MCKVNISQKKQLYQHFNLEIVLTNKDNQTATMETWLTLGDYCEDNFILSDIVQICGYPVNAQKITPIVRQHCKAWLNEREARLYGHAKY